jgi:hypothetical protein
MSAPANFFGRSTETEPRPANFYGQAGYWTVPGTWSVWEENYQRYTSPNEDHSAPVYTCVLNIDGYLLFQDLMRTRIATGQ